MMRALTIARALAVALTLPAIVMISPTHARAEAGRCTSAPEALDRFEESAAPAAVPDIAFVADGEVERSLADHRGRGVVLNFWATWCAPCVHEMPALDALHAELAGDGIEVLALSSDFGGAKVVRKFYAKNTIAHLPVLTDKRGRLAQAFEVPGLPTTILIDASGTEIGRLVGPAEWEDAAVAPFLRRCLAPAG